MTSLVPQREMIRHVIGTNRKGKLLAFNEVLLSRDRAEGLD
jgi:hypothetical protein